MDEEEKISKNLLLVIFIFGMVFLAVLLSVIMMNSPKYIAPSFADEEFSEDISPLVSAENSAEESVFPIGINTADSEELQLIPDIGPVTAKLILDYRDEYGTILTFDELLSIDGIGKKTVEILKEYCIIN